MANEKVGMVCLLEATGYTPLKDVLQKLIEITNNPAKPKRLC